MRTWKFAFAFLALVSSLATAGDGYQPQAGDLIFQISGSRQSDAVRLATGSTYGHVGIVFFVDGQPKVLEAGGSAVHYTSVDGFIRRSKDGRYVVKRLKDHAVLTPDRIQAMQ